MNIKSDVKNVIKVTKSTELKNLFVNLMTKFQYVGKRVYSHRYIARSVKQIFVSPDPIIIRVQTKDKCTLSW